MTSYPHKDMTHIIKINHDIILPGKFWHHHNQVATFPFIDYDFNIFLMTPTPVYCDVTCSSPTENKLWHHPLLMRCMTSFALMYSPASWWNSPYWKRLTGALSTTHEFFLNKKLAYSYHLIKSLETRQLRNSRAIYTEKTSQSKTRLTLKIAYKIRHSIQAYKVVVLAKPFSLPFILDICSRLLFYLV